MGCGIDLISAEENKTISETIEPYGVIGVRVPMRKPQRHAISRSGIGWIAETLLGVVVLEGVPVLGGAD